MYDKNTMDIYSVDMQNMDKNKQYLGKVKEIISGNWKQQENH